MEDSSETMSAAHQVLSTAELLELILTKLRPHDLLNAQQVSYLWSSVIISSKSIQKALYLLPDTANSSYYIDMFTNTPSPQVNPLFVQRFVQASALYALRSINPTVSFFGVDPQVKTRTAAFDDPDASWRNMLLFQPPVQQAWLKPMSARFEDPPRLLRNDDGLRMTDVVAMFEALAKDDSCGYFVHVLGCTVTRIFVWMLAPA